MLSIGELASSLFDCTNIIHFWLVGFATIKIKETVAENMVSWLKYDKDNSWYKSL